VQALGRTVRIALGIRRGNCTHPSLDQHDQPDIEIWVFSGSIPERISGLIRKDPCPADAIIMRFMVVTVNPEFRLPALNNPREVGHERRLQA
jgi:hypothetical protein